MVHLISIQNQSPGTGKESNWLPSPVDGFFLILRMFACRTGSQWNLDTYTSKCHKIKIHQKYNR